MKPHILIPLCIYFTIALAEAQEPPKIIKEENGKITSYRVEGSLASTQTVTCVPLAEAKNTFTPPDLYKGVLDCLAKDNYESAAEMFALAGIYSRFDAERVADKTAGQAKTVLIMNTFANASEEKKAKLNAALSRITSTQNVLGKLCKQVEVVGMPDYYPRYMILHGIKAFTGNANDEAIVKNFNSSAVWKNLQSAYLHCPS